jgi:hypothetical protein
LEFFFCDQRLSFVLFTFLLGVFTFPLPFSEENVVNDLMFELSSQPFKPLIRIHITFKGKVIFQPTSIFQELMQRFLIEIQRQDMGQLNKSLALEQGMNLSGIHLQFLLFDIKSFNFDKLRLQILVDPLIGFRYQILLLKHLRVDKAVVI